MVAAVLVMSAGAALAQQPAPDSAARYMALGDSIAAGYKAQPATQGYAFLLYQSGVFGPTPQVVFNNLGSVGATSEDVLLYQVPQALIPAAEGGFVPGRLTLTVGGNDIAAILRYAATNPTPFELGVFTQQALNAYAQNLGATLQALLVALPHAKVYVGNQYSVPAIQALLPGGDQVLAAFNQATANVVSAFPGRAHLVDVHAAFEGRSGLLLIDRQGASPFEVHLTNAGHRAMARAFADVIQANP